MAEKTVYENKGSPSSSEIGAVDVGHGTTRQRRFNFTLEVAQEESSFAKSKNASNADFDPIPPSKRTWNWGAYVAYWMADAWAVSNWEVGKYFSHQISKLGWWGSISDIVLLQPRPLSLSV